MNTRVCDSLRQSRVAPAMRLSLRWSTCEKLCRGLVEVVAVAANFPHQLTGLLKRDVVLLRKVVNVVRGVRCAPLDAAAPLLALRHAPGFRT